MIHPTIQSGIATWNGRFRPYQTAAIMSKVTPWRIADLCIWVGNEDRDTVLGNARLFGIRIVETDRGAT